MTSSRLDYVILYVRDLDASVEFYRDVVGLALKLQDRTYAEFAMEGTRLGLLARTELRALIGGDATDGGPAGEILFLVPDVDAEAGRLVEAGATILSGPVDRPWGHRTVHVSDPDGHVVEFAQEIPRPETP